MCFSALQGHSPEVLPDDVAHSVAACYRWDTGDEAPATFLTAVAGSTCPQSPLELNAFRCILGTTATSPAGAGSGPQAGSAKQHISFAEFSRWAKSVPRVITTLLSLLGDAPHDRPSANRNVPRLLAPTSEDCLLTGAWRWLISSWLPAEQAEV